MSLSSSGHNEYQVIARRYRPQIFMDLVGQEHVAKSLSSAIENHRIGHAYLFTGARGVGKTSSARIFAKSLNCVSGPTVTPCNECDICQGISAGEDIDVLEIDGASNRGIDEIRALRQNVNVRPSRARFKIYIIDEVHMLTREAFNALLKTLEEPPEHVKFIFCTTEPGKIPVTILSRCQRFDFAGINTPKIAERLTEIVKQEGLSADPEAILLLARRAAGSMRDGQSLLEQLLSFVKERITVQDVHHMLGTAAEDVLMEMLDHIVSRNLSGILHQVDYLVGQGNDPGLILEQLFGYFRDALAVLCGCGAESFLYASSENESRIKKYAQALGMETILAAMQIADQTLFRLKLSTQARLLVEMSLVRISSLKDLDGLQDVIVQFQKNVPCGEPEILERKNERAIPVTGGESGARILEKAENSSYVPSFSGEMPVSKGLRTGDSERSEKVIRPSDFVPVRVFSEEVGKKENLRGGENQEIKKKTEEQGHGTSVSDGEVKEGRNLGFHEKTSKEPAVKTSETSAGIHGNLAWEFGGEGPEVWVESSDISAEEDVRPEMLEARDGILSEKGDLEQKSFEKNAPWNPEKVYLEGLKRIGGGHFENLCEFQSISINEKGNVIRVNYSFLQSFPVSLLKKEENFDRLLREIELQVGHRVEVEFEVAAEDKENFENRTRMNRKKVRLDHPLVKAVEEQFGAEVVHTEVKKDKT
ncbi:MAG: DNA polymerase III subunit gamma/tau [Planctomycetia bacterium]|nr:DNA polymerase III subunit gamma/tau [Planctomycetia bacterium]